MLDREQPVTLEHSLVHPEGPVIAAEHLSDKTAPAHGRPQGRAQAQRGSDLDALARVGADDILDRDPDFREVERSHDGPEQFLAERPDGYDGPLAEPIVIPRGR